MTSRGGWLLVPAALGAVLLNLILLTGAALLARDRPVKRSAINPVPVNLVTLSRPEQEEPEPLPPPPAEPPAPPSMDFTPELARPRPEMPDLRAVRVKLDPSLWQGEPELENFVFAQGDLDEPPRAKVRTPPVYPFKARQRNIEGYVEVKLLVQPDGSVGSVEILEARPPGVFDQAALDAVPHWRFSPGLIEGRAVPSWVITRVVFTMNEAP